MTQTIRTTAPEPLLPVPFQIPNAFETTLPNGLRIVIFDDKRLPLVSYRLAFLSGDAHDPQDSHGLTSATTSMMTEGTANYSSRELAEKIERLGASLSVSSSDDFTIVSGSALRMYRTEIIDLIREVVFRPTFPEDELDLYRRNTIENLKFQRSQPNFLANEQTARKLYSQHPYAVISPTPHEVQKITRESLIELHKARFVPNNAIFIAVGDVDREDLLSEIEQRFGDWEAGEIRANNFSSTAFQNCRTITIVDRPGSAQTNIVLANIAFERNHPDYFASLVMNQVLGAGASSRVFMNLREEKGYTYGAYTKLGTKRFAGDFEATAEVRSAVTGDSLKEFFYELNRIRDEKVAVGELADAKSYLTGVFPIRAETQEGLASLIVNQQLFGLPQDYLQTYRDEIDSITIEDVQRVAKNYIHPDSMAIILVGDAGEILQQVREYAEGIEVFDTDGNEKKLSDYEINTSSEAANAAGIWNLTLDFQGQQVPITLTLEQKGSSISGKLETVLGNGEISEGKVSGNKLTATANTEIQGQTVDFVINGNADGDAITGTISAAIIPDSLTFTGTRKSQAGAAN